MRWRRAVVGLGLALWASAAWAQEGAVEASLLLGGLSGASVDAARGSAGEFGPTGGFAWGAAVSYNFGDNSAIELQWTRRKGELAVDGVARSGLTQDVLHAQCLVFTGDPYAPVRPYLLAGGGASLMKPRGTGGEDANRFSLALGGGVKLLLRDWLGLRAQARYVATHLSSSAGGYFCDPQSGCLYVAQAAFLHQGEYTVGLVLRY